MTEQASGSRFELDMDAHNNPLKHPLPQYYGVDNETGTLWIGRFTAMAGDCEVLVEGVSLDIFRILFEAAVRETWRIEHKYSRYESDNTMADLNRSHGCPVRVDDETSALLDFADQCYQMSDGLFDVTSGVLRRVWRFDGSDNVPDPEDVKALLDCIGWKKVRWHQPELELGPGMELDFGGIGKEYAVDRALLSIRQALLSMGKSAGQDAEACSYVVNFGGDLACSGARLNGEPWVIGVESSERDQQSVATVSLSGGAVATSGDSRRFLLKDNIRYSHILNPLTGWAMTEAPRAVSVAAPSCLYAGVLSTLAMLHGVHAESFLATQEVSYWLQP